MSVTQDQAARYKEMTMAQLESHLAFWKERMDDTYMVRAALPNELYQIIKLEIAERIGRKHD